MKIKFDKKMYSVTDRCLLCGFTLTIKKDDPQDPLMELGTCENPDCPAEKVRVSFCEGTLREYLRLQVGIILDEAGIADVGSERDAEWLTRDIVDTVVETIEAWLDEN
jgi:hypothetical protein